MIITCQNCGARYKIKDELVAGGVKRAKCKKCGEPILIKPPAEKPEAAAAVESPPAPSPGDSMQVPDEPADVSSRPAAETAQQAVQGGEENARTPQSSEPRTAATAAPPEPEQEEVAGRETAEPEPGEEKAALAEKAEPGETKSEESQSEAESAEPESAAGQTTGQEDIQEKLERRRREMEDEISGRLNKAALETLDFDILSELAQKIKDIEQNVGYKQEKDNQFFACIQCRTIFSLFPDDPRLCTNCSGDVSLVRGDDILKQFGMFS